jgi:hypothetical protein
LKIESSPSSDPETWVATFEKSIKDKA